MRRIGHRLFALFVMLLVKDSSGGSQSLAAAHPNIATLYPERSSTRLVLQYGLAVGKLPCNHANAAGG